MCMSIEGQGHFLTLVQSHVHTEFKPDFSETTVPYESYQVQGNENLMT